MLLLKGKGLDTIIDEVKKRSGASQFIRGKHASLDPFGKVLGDDYAHGLGDLTQGLATARTIAYNQTRRGGVRITDVRKRTAEAVKRGEEVPLEWAATMEEDMMKNATSKSGTQGAQPIAGPSHTIAIPNPYLVHPPSSSSSAPLKPSERPQPAACHGLPGFFGQVGLALPIHVGPPLYPYYIPYSEPQFSDPTVSPASAPGVDRLAVVTPRASNGDAPNDRETSGANADFSHADKKRQNYEGADSPDGGDSALPRLAKRLKSAGSDPGPP